MPVSPSPFPPSLCRRPPHSRPSTLPWSSARHRAPSINSRSGPTDHSPTRAQPQPARARSEDPMAPWLVLRPELQGGNTNFPLIASLEGSLRASGRAGARGPQAGLVEEPQYSQGGRGETLPFCTPVTSSRALVRSGPLPRWGPVRSPLGWEAPSGAGLTRRAQGLGLPLSYRRPA